MADDRLYYLADANYNVTGLVKYDSNAQQWNVAERYTYDPYGEVTYCDSTWTAYTNQVSAYSNTPLFAGRTLDTATSLYYNRARYYDATLERFISRDPIGYDGGINLYEYAGDNPVSRRDSSGTIGEGERRIFWNDDGTPTRFPSIPVSPGSVKSDCSCEKIASDNDGYGKCAKKVYDEVMKAYADNDAALKEFLAKADASLAYGIAKCEREHSDNGAARSLCIILVRSANDILVGMGWSAWTAMAGAISASETAGYLGCAMAFPCHT